MRGRKGGRQGMKHFSFHMLLQKVNKEANVLLYLKRDVLQLEHSSSEYLYAE